MPLRLHPKRQVSELNTPIIIQQSNPSTKLPGFLELCAGSAILSFTAEQMGFFPIPVDHDRNKFSSKLPTVKLDLVEEASVDICLQLLNSGTIQVVTAAVPCGTASRAREIPIKNGPKPLRNDSYPYGLPDLKGPDLARVTAANKIYALVQGYRERPCLVALVFVSPHP